MNFNADDNPTPIFVDVSWKNALAYLKTLPLEAQAYLMNSMQQGLAQEADRFRREVRGSGESQAKQQELMRGCASITSERRTR